MTDRRQGSMLMEFVITMPILLLLVMFVLQLAYLQLAHECTAYAAFCAARAVCVVNVLEQKSVAEKAAERALSWFHAQGLKGGGEKADYDIPGWGKVPGSDTIGEHVEVKLEMLGIAPNLSGQASLSAVTVTYDCPLMIPIVGEIMAKALDGGKKDGEHFPCAAISETCALPMPYSTLHHPLGGCR